ncbi:MAG: hypothetical protein EAX90_01620 [Candidatus Heimdallarchaeota archaeon]|nr:hypothetical protein [Candidatus Heimdallarchaeota archaeon]
MLHDYNALSIDMHVHVDERVKYTQIPTILRARNLDGVGILTHNNFSFAEKIVKMFSEKDKEKIYFAGVEIDTLDGHLIAYGINQEIPQGLASEETLEIIKDLGGVSIIPHPFMSHNSIGWKSYRLKTDAMEFYNGFAKIFLNFPNFMAEVAFRYNGYGKVAGSDAHYAKAIGTCYTIIDIEDIPSEESILEAIRKHRTKPVIRPIDINDIGNFIKVIFTPKEGRKVVKI